MSDLADLETRIATKEAAVRPPVRDGCEARVVWAGAPAVQTDLAVVFVHGFSASPEEIRPVPDKVAAAFDANLYLARLTGHGQDGAAMGAATLAAWQKDVEDALNVGRQLGRRTVLMGCSTGCTLNTLAVAGGAEVAGVVHVSPNYGLTSKAAQWLLDAPGVRTWGKWVVGRDRVFEPFNAAHAAYWTVRYPTEALYPMGDAIRAVRTAKLGQIKAPGLFLYAEADKVVSPSETRKVMARWGGTVTSKLFTMGPEDDLNSHVIAGDVLSPSQTDGAAETIVEWLRQVL